MKKFFQLLNLKTLKSELRIVFAVLIVFPILILGVYAYMVSRNNLITQTKTAMRGNADVIASGIDNNVKKENDVVKFFSYEMDFRKALEHADRNPYALTEQLNEVIEPLIWYYKSSDINLTDLHIYSTLLPEDHIGDFASVPTSEKELEWYEKCSTEYSTMWMVDEEGGVYLIKTLLDAATSSKQIGMMTLKVNNDQFFSMVNQSSYLTNGIYILGNTGKIMYHKKTEDAELDDAIYKDIMQGVVDDIPGNFVASDAYFLMASDKMSNGWRVYYYVSRGTIITDVFKILSTVIFLALIIFVASFGIASIFASRISGRIENLNNMANEVKAGNFDIRSNESFDDEISKLGHSMTDMARRLGEMVDEINRRNEEDLKMKDSDIHYREWLFDFVVERNNDILAVIGEDSYEPSFVTSNVKMAIGLPLSSIKSDIRRISDAQIEDERFAENVRIADKIEESLRTGEIIVMDEIKFEHMETGEHLYYRGVIVSTIDDGGKRLALALYDRTQEFRRNHQLQEALNAAETANKAKTSFLANMSHDFRTPMNAITGFNLLIEKHSEDPEKVREYTHKISLASHNLLSLLNDVLDMSKIESGKTTLDVQEMSIGLLLEEINSVISFQAKAKNQEYVVNTGTLTHDLFLGDKKRVNEILMNILGNAIKYTPEGGRVELTIDESTTSSEGFNNLRFTIADNGIGMKAEYKDKIFDAFSREEKGATKTIQGTGLGMAITKSLVELMGGTIRVDSEEGKGSTFIVNLRLQVVEEVQDDIWKAHGIKTFLGVNKNLEENVFFREKLQASNLDGQITNTGMDAISMINALADEDKFFDFIMIDDSIDDISPVELIRQIRAKDKRNNSLIMLATGNLDKYEDEAKAAGCYGVLQKPITDFSIKTMFGDSKEKEKEEDDTPKNPLQGLKFLAAEDNDINADILIELMDMEGATVTRGENGQEVVDMFKAAKEGDYDMILMDIQMPVMNGYEAAAAIRALGTEWSQNIPIIAMTANAYADDVQQAFDSGMNAHITKPIDIKIVEKTILEFRKK
jgi:signal transduction histidine kinase/CheY-like chemotaxis protein